MWWSKKGIVSDRTAVRPPYRLSCLIATGIVVLGTIECKSIADREKYLGIHFGNWLPNPSLVEIMLVTNYRKPSWPNYCYFSVTGPVAHPKSLWSDMNKLKRHRNGNPPNKKNKHEQIPPPKKIRTNTQNGNIEKTKYSQSAWLTKTNFSARVWYCSLLGDPKLQSQRNR